MSEKKDRIIRRAKDFEWICGECAIKAGGKWKVPSLTAPVRRGHCKSCEAKDVILLPTESFEF